MELKLAELARLQLASGARKCSRRTAMQQNTAFGWKCLAALMHAESKIVFLVDLGKVRKTHKQTKCDLAKTTTQKLMKC